MDPKPLLTIKDLEVDFVTFNGRVQALEGVDLEILRDETLGLVGESGCGKSVTAMSLLRLLPVPPAEHKAGEAIFRWEGREIDLLRATEKEMLGIRGNEISMIFQEPMTSL